MPMDAIHDSRCTTADNETAPLRRYTTLLRRHARLRLANECAWAPALAAPLKINHISDTAATIHTTDIPVTGDQPMCTQPSVSSKPCELCKCARRLAKRVATLPNGIISSRLSAYSTNDPATSTNVV